jgi:hypothetical protein
MIHPPDCVLFTGGAAFDLMLADDTHGLAAHSRPPAARGTP